MDGLAFSKNEEEINGFNHTISMYFLASASGFFGMKFHQNITWLVSTFSTQMMQHKTSSYSKGNDIRLPCWINYEWIKFIFQRLLIPLNYKRFSLEHSKTFIHENCLTRFFLLQYCLMLKSFRDSFGWKTTKYKRNYEFGQGNTIFRSAFK